MSTTVGTLTIDMVANIARLQKGMDEARKTVDGAMQSVTKTVETAMRSVGTLFAGVSIGAFAGKLIAVEREFGALNASLITVTGSAREADKAFAMLTNFASNTPFSLQEVTAAFIKLKALGMDPSAEALRSYGNTASAMGKSLNQMIEAVADAATGEFERLKEFGIRAKSEGDRVTLTFRGVSTNIGKNAAEIESYLRRIGDVDFAGAMDARAKTLDGAISNLGDSWDALFRTINDEMTGPLLMAAVQSAQTAIVGLSAVVKNFTQFMDDNKVALMAFAAILAGPAIVSGIGAAATAFVALRTAVVGLTLAFASNPIALAILAITAAAVPAIVGIQNYMNANKELEKEQAGLNQTQAETERLLRQAEPVKAKAVVSTKAITDAEKERAKELKKQEDSYTKLLNDINGKTGAMLLEQQQTEKLSDSQKLALKIMQDIQTGTLKLNDAQKIKITQSLEDLLTTERLNAEMKDLAKTQQAAIALSDKLNEENYRTTESMRSTVVSLMEQNEELRDGKEAVIARQVAVMRATATDLEFASTMVEGNEHLAEQARLLRQQADLTEDNAMLTAAKEANKELDKTTKSVESIEPSLTDALMRGFESGKGFGQNLKDTLDNMFKTLVLKPIIEPIAKGASSVLLSMMGMAAPGTASAGGGGGGAAGMMQGLSLSMQAFGSTMGTGFVNTILGSGGAGSMGAAQSMFSTGNYAQAAGMGAGTLAAYGAGAAVGVYGGRAISNGYAVSGSGNGMVNAGTAIGMVLGGPIGAAIGGAIAGGVNRLFGRKQTDMGIEGTLTAAEGIEGQSYRFLKGGVFRSNKTVRDALSSEVEAMFDGAIELISEQTRGYAKALGLPASAIDSFTQQIKLSFQGLSEEEINQKIADTLAEFQEGLASQYASALEPLKIAGETFTQTLERLMAIQDVSTYLNEFGGAFSNFATASVTARQGIIDLAGGLDALVQKTQGFVANFYTREEQAAITAKGVVAGLTTAGFTASQIAALETRADLRTLLESVDVNTESGQKQFVAILDLQQQFADLAPLIEEQNSNLYALIEASPQVEILQRMFESDAAYQERVTQAEDVANAMYVQMVEGINAVNDSIQHMTTTLANRMGEFTASASSVIDAYASIGRPVEGQFNIDREGFEYWIEKLNAGLIVASRLPAYFKQAAEELVAKDPSADFAQHYLDLVSARGFASGGYMTGPALVGEHGPELFDPRTSQIYTAPATNDIFGGNEVAAEIRALRDEVTMMRSETRSTAVNTAKIARLQDNWDVRGLTVRTDVDQPLDTVAV
jgi:hypothetical protein